MGGCAAIASLALFTADLAQQLQRCLIGRGQGLVIALRRQPVALALGHDPVASQIAVDPDNKKIMIFLPAHNQGSVTVQ